MNNNESQRHVPTSARGLGRRRHGRGLAAADRLGRRRSTSTSSSSSTAPRAGQHRPDRQAVVVVGGGMAGMTAAKYLRLWGGSGVQVTLVEPDTRLHLQHHEQPGAQRQPHRGIAAVQRAMR